MKAITRTIWILSLISLFTDMASEMLYPVMPLYLETIGFTVLYIGILEGLAEATASLSKGYFGKISDASGKRAPFVKIGYSISAISKPMVILFTYPLWVFFSRTLDRLGKGIRTGARDAVLADESAHTDRGKVFGFHRSMDTLGAAIGPSIALLYLYFNPHGYKPLFIVAFFPGIIAVILTLLVKDTGKLPVQEKARVSFFSQFKYWNESSPDYRRLMVGLLFFAIFNSSDVFLILKLKDSGIGDLHVIAMYVFYNLVYALAAFPMGIIADKLGLKNMFLLGLAIFAGVYSGMVYKQSTPIYIGLFFLYGLYYACTEGIAKAWISNLCDKKDTATAIGVYSGLQSICTLIASSLTGLIWYKIGSAYAFTVTAVASVLVLFYLMLNKGLSPKGSI